MIGYRFMEPNATCRPDGDIGDVCRQKYRTRSGETTGNAAFH